jgi:hypothetical protein
VAARVGLVRIPGVGSRQRGDCDPRAQLQDTAQHGLAHPPNPMFVWECPQSVSDLGFTAVEPSVSSLREMLEILRASRVKWKFGRSVEDIAVGSAERSPDSALLWTVTCAVTREASEIWSISTTKRDPQTNYSQWKVAVSRDGTVIATKIGDLGSRKTERLVSWASDRTGIPEIDSGTSELFSQLLERLPDVARQAMPRWVVARSGHLNARIATGNAGLR